MIIKCKRDFARPGRAFKKGEVVELPDDEAKRYLGLGLAETHAGPAPEQPAAPAAGETRRRRNAPSSPDVAPAE